MGGELRLWAMGTNPVARGLELTVPPDLSGEKKKAWRLKLSPVVDDFISQAYITKPPYTLPPTPMGFGELPGW